jgi:NAD+ diphosphatase
MNSNGENMSKGLYIFMGTSIVVPQDRTDSELENEVPEDLAKVLAGCESADVFTIPLTDGATTVTACALKETNFDDPEISGAWKAIPMRQAVHLMTGGVMAQGKGKIGAILRAFHIAQWRNESRFCGSCGHANTDAVTGELARQCPSCGRLEFPRIAPAVITLVTDKNGNALLAHNKKFAQGVYSLIAGFNEAGESLEDTVAREIREEVSIEVDNIRYVKSQPWPFPNCLMLGFTAEYKSGEIKCDGVEIEDARWFTKDELPLLPGNGSISRYLINLWLNGSV